MYPPMRRPLLAVAAAVAVLILSAGCGGTSAVTSDGRIRVVAAENVWGDIAAQIGGDQVSVHSLISDPRQDPHAVESSPHDAALVAAARLVVVNGVGYDDFATKLLSVGGSDKRAVLTVADAVGARGDNVNPHLWYDPSYVQQAARAIAGELRHADPTHANTFSQNLTRFLAAYQPYSQVLAQIKSHFPGAPISYTERVPGYLVAAAGLRLATPASFAQAIEDGNDPSPGDNAAMDAALTGHQVRLLFYNNQVTSPTTSHVRSLALEQHIPVIGVSETIPTDQPTFQAWQITQARAVLAALGGSDGQ
jgi:zinc/manganese transport system substrate-binding protein